MDRESLPLVLVGHVDHGKSTLIGRLLYDTKSLPDGKIEEVRAAARTQGRELEFAFIMDHLREERERGITIDTAQTFFSSPTRDYVIIDAPGHKAFIKNMVTGASQAEAAILLCSVSEGVQEQTRRHAYLVKLLGVEQVMVAYNKMDLVDYRQERFRQVKKDMDEFLARIQVKPRMEVPISAQRGDNIARRSDNMPWYDGPAVVEALDLFRKMPPAVEKVLRFPVQDIYERDGVRIVAGRVESGVLHSGQRLRFLPDDEPATALRILRHGREDLQQAEAGQCVGVVFDNEDLSRGQVGCSTHDRPHVTRRFRASLFWLSPAPLEIGADGLTLKCATQEQPCRIAALRERIDSGSLEQLAADAGRLEETEVGEVVIETAGPVVLESFYEVQELGRFVLIMGRGSGVSSRQVVAGGVITHPLG